MSSHYHYCISGEVNKVLLNKNHTNDYNTTSLSSSFLDVAVIVAVALALVRCVYSNYSVQANNHSAMKLSVLHAGRVQRIMYTNDNNSSTPFSSLSAGAVAYPWIQHMNST